MTLEGGLTLHYVSCQVKAHKCNHLGFITLPENKNASLLEPHIISNKNNYAALYLTDTFIHGTVQMTILIQIQTKKKNSKRRRTCTKSHSFAGNKN